MFVIEQFVARDTPAGKQLVLPFETRCKSRLRTKLASGEECGLFLERGTVLQGGDKLKANDGTIIEVVAAPEALMQASSDDPLKLARAAYHLGNRHVVVQILPGKLRFPRDHVLGEMVAGLDVELTDINAPFEPESGAYGWNSGGHNLAHAHPPGHSADGEGRGARIHDFSAQR